MTSSLIESVSWGCEAAAVITVASAYNELDIIVRYLVERGADPNIRDENGCTAYSYAEGKSEQFLEIKLNDCL